MLARVLAFWLVALIVTPFSAPFSVCDVNALAHDQQHSHRSSVSVDHQSTAHALPMSRTSPRIESLRATAATGPVVRPRHVRINELAEASAFRALRCGPPLRI